MRLSASFVSESTEKNLNEIRYYESSLDFVSRTGDGIKQRFVSQRNKSIPFRRARKIATSD
jgi:hypothetical protein